MTLAGGMRLGPYEILNLLGAGGMGEVYRAKDTRLGRDVAIKIMPSIYSDDPSRLRRFEQEARTAGMLNHPNILAIYDIGTHEGSPYVVSELLEGETLGSRVAAGIVPWRKALAFGLQVAQGLVAAHSKGVVHRDLKPDNIFITKDGRAKILDFGLAKLIQRDAVEPGKTLAALAETQAGTVLGTPGYMSPEQARGMPTDHRSDLFSLGTILYEMLAGQRAFKGESAVESMNATLKDEPPPIPEGKTDLPAVAERVVRHCLEKDPEERFQSARDLVFALETLLGAPSTPAAAAPPPEAERIAPQQASARRILSGAVVAVVIAAAAAFWAGKGAGRQAPLSFQRLTFRQGAIWSARFAPEGRTIVYSAAWEGKPVEVFWTQPDSPESRSLGVVGADVLAVSPSSELALLLKGGSPIEWGWKWGTLARSSLAGGAPREALRGVQLADWGPDGAEPGVVRAVGSKARVEFPVGKLLYETSDRIGALRISPKGDRIAIAERPPGLGGGWTGAQRLLARMAVPLQLFDVARDGRVLIGRSYWRSGIVGVAPGDAEEREFSWLDASEVDDVSYDGKALLITEFGEGGGPGRWSVYLRRLDDSPAVRLGDGQAFALSPDGSKALALRRVPSPQLVLWPTGAGEPIFLKNDKITDYHGADWLPDGKRIVFSGAEPGHGPRCYLQDIASSETRAITPEGVTLRLGQRAVSPDGEWVAATGPDGRVALYPIAGGEARLISGLEPWDVPIRWSSDERSLFVFRKGESPPKVYQVDLSGGRGAVWKEIRPRDPAGIIDVWGVHVGPDERSYYYCYMRNLADLHLVEGLR
ncbi:MAG: serine/threonine-protein kinase [Acidobacteria bacterium]|nr:serine/threonine-protein kinase [Acidobacteriota bacterium]